MTSSTAQSVDDEGTAAPPTPTPTRWRLPRFGLSATQLVATALAAITATFLASYLGVSGTIIGAAVASVSTAIGNAVYGQSLRSTRDRVRTAVPVRQARTDPASPTVVLPAAGVADEEPALPARGAPRAVRSDGRPVTPATAWRRVAFVAVGMFAVVLALVTSVELLAGRPVTDLVRGDSGSGTTLFGGSGTTATVTPSAPTVTMTVTPKVVLTTPTVTQTPPAVTKSAAPTTVTPTTTAPTAPTGPTGPTGPSGGGTPTTPVTTQPVTTRPGTTPPPG